jgi:hypothetical protein
MAKLFDVLGNAKKMDLYRVAKNESVPKRGRKKHYSQMTKDEKDSLFARLRGIKGWKLSNHSLDRLVEKNIHATYYDIVSTIHKSRIIEYHIVKMKEKDVNINDERVLLRSNAVVNGDYNLHVVYSITRKKIVSVWINKVDDIHSTIDMRDYDKNVKIIGA